MRCSKVAQLVSAIVGTSVIHRDLTALEHAVQYARSLIEAASVYRDLNGKALGVLAVARDASKPREQSVAEAIVEVGLEV